MRHPALFQQGTEHPHNYWSGFLIPHLTGGSRRSHWRGPAAASAKNTEQISELGGSGGMPRGNFFLIMQNAANWAIFIFFVRPWGGHGPPASPLGTDATAGPPWFVTFVCEILMQEFRSSC